MKTILILAFIFLAYWLGYLIGYYNCIDYIKQKLQEFRNGDK